MGNRSQASMNPTLTAYAQGLTQDLGSQLANFIAPVVTVPATIGQYKAYNDKNAFQVVDTGRAVGGPAKRLEFSSSDPTFNCQPQALEIPIDDSERDAAGDANATLEEAKTKTLVSSSIISHETKVFTAAAAGVAAQAGFGVWSDSAVDPIKEIDAVIEAIATNTGMMPNRIAFGLGAWRVFRNHPKVLARQPGAQIVGVTAGQAAQMLLNPGIEIRVGVLSKDTTKFGKDKSAENIVGGRLYIFIGSQSPTQYDPSFMKTFMGGVGGVDAVRMYRADSNRSDILACDWSEDIKVTSTSCGKRIDVS